MQWGAGALLAVASVLVPSDRRAEWREEWSAELETLRRARQEGVRGLPTPIEFAIGVLPHGMWMRTEGWTMDSVVQDLRFAWRVLRRAPVFTLVAAGTLALGIGANASIFSLVNGLVLSAPAGIEDPSRVVQIARSYTDDPRWDNFSWPAMQTISGAESFSGVAGFSSESFVVGAGTEAEQLVGLLVTGSYFDVLGARAALGRTIQEDDDMRPGAHPVVMLSHGLWVRRYGRDPDIVGSTILIGSVPYDVIGITAPGFAGAESIGAPPELFVPTMQHPGYFGTLPFEQWGTSWIDVVGRLQDDQTFQQAEAEMEVMAARLRAADPANENILVLLADGLGLDPESRSEARQISWLLLMIVGLVLLITCTNVANLLLARASARREEVGVRMALGAGRARLARQLITESALLAALATLMAVPIVLAAGSVLPAVFPYTLSVSVSADGRVLAFMLATGAVAGVLFGLAPAWTAARGDITRALREGASTRRPRTRLRDALVVSQLGVSLGLVAGAALLAQSVFNASSADPGFVADGVTVGLVDLTSTGRYDREAGRAFAQAVHRQAAAIPGVRSATLANQAPIAGGHMSSSASPVGRDDVSFEAEHIIVGPDYFETLGITVARGRPLGGFGEEPEPVVVVNQALADLFWPGQDALGQEIDRGGVYRVVGIVDDVQMRSLRAPARPAIYHHFDQLYSGRLVVHLSGEGGTPPGAEGLRGAVAEVDPGLPVVAVQTLRGAVARSMGETRTIGSLVAIFAGLALVLAIVGLYGLVSFGATQRVREIGIRIALGARPDSLVRLILARGVGIAVLGISLGVVVSMALGSALEGLLFQVEPTDVSTLVVAAALLLAVAGVASWLPARKASRVDAAISLRSEA